MRPDHTSDLLAQIAMPPECRTAEKATLPTQGTFCQSNTGTKSQFYLKWY